MAESHFILVFERKEPDATWLQEAFAGRVPNPGRVIRTSEGVQDYIEGRAPYADREQFPFPSLVLLDLDYPVVSLNLLQWFHQTGFSALCPVLGVGHALPDIIIQRAFDAGLNGYFEKPGDLASLAKVVCELEWVADLRHKQAMPGVKLLSREDYFAKQPTS